MHHTSLRTLTNWVLLFLRYKIKSILDPIQELKWLLCRFIWYLGYRSHYIIKQNRKHWLPMSFQRLSMSQVLKALPNWYWDCNSVPGWSQRARIWGLDSDLIACQVEQNSFQLMHSNKPISSLQHHVPWKEKLYKIKMFRAEILRMEVPQKRAWTPSPLTHQTAALLAWIASVTVSRQFSDDSCKGTRVSWSSF